MRITMRDIEKAVAARFQLYPWELKSQDCSRRVARPRQIAMFLCREYGRKPYPLIGRYFNRHHTTILAGHRRIVSLMAENPEVAAHVAGCREILALRLNL